jgi:hypothetical protein
VNTAEVVRGVFLFSSELYFTNVITGFAAFWQVNIKGKVLQESKVRNISTVDASELVELFYHSGMNGILAVVFFS